MVSQARGQRAGKLDRGRTEVESDLLSYSPSPTDTPVDSARRHVQQVEIKCVLTNLFSLAKTGNSPMLGRWSSVSPLSPPTHFGKPWKVVGADFSEPVCWERQDHRDLSSSPAGQAAPAAPALGARGERRALTNPATRGR